MNELQRQRLERLAEVHDAVFSDPHLSNWQSQMDYERRRIIGQAFRLMLGVANLSRTTAAQWAYEQAVEFARRNNQRQLATYTQTQGFKHPYGDDKILNEQSFAERTKTSVLVLTHFLED